MLESFGAQGTLVEAMCGMEEDMELEITAMGHGKGAMGTAERWQDQRHALVGKVGLFCR